MSEDRDRQGRFVPGNRAAVQSGASGKKRGRKKKDQQFSKRFLEDVLMRKYGGTAMGAVNAIEDLLSKLSEKDQVAVHMRLLELGARIVPKDLRIDSGPSITVISAGVRPIPCWSCNALPKALMNQGPEQQYVDLDAVEMTASVIPPLPSKKDTRPRPFLPEQCPGMEKRKQQAPPEKSQQEIDQEEFEARQLAAINKTLEEEDDAIRNKTSLKTYDIGVKGS